MAPTTLPDDSTQLDILAVTQGQWGERIADNIHRRSRPSWTAQHWSAPRALPLVIDDPSDFLPASLPRVNLVLALGETAGVAQLIPNIVQMTGAKSVIAPIDRNESLPPGLVAQLQGWLDELGATVVFPKPFCSLTESTYNRPPIEVKYADPVIRHFARHFGRPRFQITVTPERQIGKVQVLKDSACGCAQYVAEGLRGCAVVEAEHQAGMLHHHYPCLASMNQDADYHDTLMHISGYVLREAVKEQIFEYLEPAPYLRPDGRVDGGESDASTSHQS